jgi:molecular chaperone GrpE
MENTQIEEPTKENIEEFVEKVSYTQEEVEKIKRESNDKYLRIFAEFENYKKRVSKEKEDLKVNTKTMMLTSILDLDSDLSIAVKSSKDVDGLKLIMSKLEKFLNSHGVESIQTDTYDSDLHEVVSVLEIGEEKIMDVVNKGYSVNGKPFRFPKIILGK